MEQIFGYVERITFSNPDNGFVVARVKQPRKEELTTIVGAMPGLIPGEEVRLLGEWKQDPTYGVQFVVSSWQAENPSDVVGIRKYLESGMVRGIGPIYAERIVSRFGADTLTVIDQKPDLLLKVSGIGTKRIAKIRACWEEQKAIRDLMLFLQRHEISPSFAHRLYKLYGQETRARLQENPYRLAREVRGIGFKTADRVAHNLGFPKDSTQRCDAGIEYTLLELADEGHVCYPLDALQERVEQILEVPITGRLAALEQEGRIVREGAFIWMKGLWLCEQGIVREYRRLTGAASRLRRVESGEAIRWAEKKLHLNLAEKQKEAVAAALKEKFLIITGGPGTGKSTITRAILAITSMLTRSILLTAPTGRAAKRMSEITRHDASTIHSLLQFDFSTQQFRRNRENPLPCDLLIIDEASMIDTSLMYHLLKAIPDQARVLLIGDVYQLPSVGPGTVLKDLIESQKVPVFTLTDIFRQAAGSRIITNAHKIHAGLFPDLSFEKQSDFFFLKGETPEEVVEQILSLVTKRLPTYYRFHPIHDIQVLTPMKRGIVGTEQLNQKLQAALNPQERVLLYRGCRFGCGDKVMQIRNNYTKEVYNGDIGRVESLDEEKRELTVLFDGKRVAYSLFALDELVLAYATSVHKYQGSECPCVIIPIHTTHFVMLHRNLLYTAITRGKRLVVLVGTGRAIAIAVSTNDTAQRHTGLSRFLAAAEAPLATAYAPPLSPPPPHG